MAPSTMPLPDANLGFHAGPINRAELVNCWKAVIEAIDVDDEST